MKLSVVIPVYNEGQGICIFHDQHLSKALNELSIDDYEVIYVNDGSKDDTLSKLHTLAKEDIHIKIVSLSRNFGKEIATSAGISISRGDATILIDGDGQHPPELIANFLELWKNGALVVVGVRESNKDEGVIKKVGSKLFYKIFNYASGTKIVPRSTDYRLIDASVRKEFSRFKERNRITRGLIDWLGFEPSFIYFNSPARLAGTANYKTSQLIKLASNSFVSLSLTPLFIFGWIGLCITLFTLIFGTFVFVEQIILQDPLNLNFTGSALLGVLISFLVGMILISQGIMAVYISHIHTQAQERPLFVIDYKKSFGITPK